jgi:hypothetical protein
MCRSTLGRGDSFHAYFERIYSRRSVRSRAKFRIDLGCASFCGRALLRYQGRFKGVLTDSDELCVGCLAVARSSPASWARVGPGQ